MKFTGERFIPTEFGEIRLEHFHRYAFVFDIVIGKKVLDVACGEGYGSSLMAEVARSVVGVDISEESIIHATQTYKKSNLSFLQGSAAKLDFPNDSFDAVVSFETIEHLSEQPDMIAEIRRVLRTNGVLIISSPNRPVYSGESGGHNEFHVKELDFDEFDGLLKTTFPAIRYYGQRILMGSVIQSLKETTTNFQTWRETDSNLIPEAPSLNKPVYFVALASTDATYLPDVKSSVMYPETLDLMSHYIESAKLANRLNVEVEENKSIINDLKQSLTERDIIINDLRRFVSERDLVIGKLNESVIGRDAVISNFNQLIAERDVVISNFNQLIAERDAVINKLNQENRMLNRDFTQIQSNLLRHEQETNKLRESLNNSGSRMAELNNEINEIRVKIASFENSISWRITSPLRKINKLINNK